MGVAVKNGDNWRIYDKAKAEITDVGDMQLGNFPIFILPTIKLAEGDLVKYEGEYYFVNKIESGVIKALCVKTGEVKTLLPIKNLMGFSCYSKLVAINDFIDMGTDFDWMMELSHHGAAGVTPEQEKNRALLRGVMTWAGFRPIESEWWHYTLMTEPYPDTYFDFDIRRKKVYRKEGRFYCQNPIALIIDDGNYYFIGYDERYKTPINYRVDRMDQVRPCSYDKEELREFEKFDIKKHKKQLFGMYGGEGQEVRFRVDKSLIDVVFDVFGVDTKFTVLNDGTYEFKAEVQLSPQFYGWCCSFGGKLKVIAPTVVVNTLKEYIENLSNNY
jgi:hypothetical protein